MDTLGFSGHFRLQCFPTLMRFSVQRIGSSIKCRDANKFERPNTIVKFALGDSLELWRRIVEHYCISTLQVPPQVWGRNTGRVSRYWIHTNSLFMENIQLFVSFSCGRNLIHIKLIQCFRVEKKITQILEIR